MIAPNLEAFAKRSQVFSECRLGSFPTVPARADIATGKFAFTFTGWSALPQEEKTMAAYMNDLGYLTCGVADNPFLLRNGYGYDRGFQDFFWIKGQRGGAEGVDTKSTWTSESDRCAPQTFSTAIDWIERHQDEKFFLYVEPWDPHEPWDAPDHYVKQYLPDYEGEKVFPAYWDVGDAGVTERDLEVAHAGYRAEITVVDQWFGKLIDRLDSLDLMKDTTVLFASDHGFYFGEHGIFGKRRFLWDKKIPQNQQRIGTAGQTGYYYSCPLHQELTRVPFVMHHPRLEPRQHDCLLSLCDLLPTMVELGGGTPPDDIHGKSLVPVLEGNTQQHRDIVVSADADAHMMRDISKAVDDVPRLILETCPSTICYGEWEFIYAREGDPHALYHRFNDPDHKHDLAKDHPEIVARLHAKYVDWMDQHGVPEASKAVRRRL
nr:sulfatase [Ruegeria sp. EL01]